MREEWRTERFDSIMTAAKVARCGDKKALPILSITMHGGIVLQKERFSKVIASSDNSNYKIVKNGQLVIAFPIDEGLIYTQDLVDEGIMSPAYNIYDVDYNLVNRRFLIYYFHSPFAFSYYKSKLRGSTQRRRSMDKGDLLSMPIPVPPLPTQQQIVEELDLLSGIIEKQKAQLKELDSLAQSLFYDMFGDPVANEKGWEVKKFGVVYKLKSGDGLSSKQFIEGPYPVYGGNGVAGCHVNYNKDGDYIIIGRVGVYCGNVRNVKGKFWLTDNAFQLFYDENKQSPIFVTYLLNFLDLHQYANHAAQPVISNITLKDVSIIFPPLPLQQQFAERIASIEHQKSLIQQQLKETETLFNSRMDYYFN